jgi:hypothetical protein
MKKILKTLSLLLTISLFFASLSPSIQTYAKSQDNAYSIVIDENDYISIEETYSSVRADYYENGTRIQTAVLTKSTGEIDYQEYDRKIFKLGKVSINGPEKKIKTEKHNIHEYERIDQSKVLAPLRANGNSFNYLMSKTVQSGGVSYFRLLYGYQDSKAYKKGNWAFSAGTAIAVVSVALYFAPELCSKILGGILTAGGLILQAFSTTVTKVDYYWVYKFVQSRPTSMDFICSNTFVYKTEYEAITGDNKIYWVTEYEKPDYEIQMERNDILDHPGLYY